MATGVKVFSASAARSVQRTIRPKPWIAMRAMVSPPDRQVYVIGTTVPGSEAMVEGAWTVVGHMPIMVDGSWASADEPSTRVDATSTVAGGVSTMVDDPST
jgi:hypothetical protein